MTAQSPAVSQPLGGSNFGRSNCAVDDTKTSPNMSLTCLHDVLCDVLFEELQDFRL